MSNENLTNEIMALLEAGGHVSASTLDADRAAVAKREEIRTGIIEWFVEIEGGEQMRAILSGLLEHLGMDPYEPVKKWRVEVEYQGATLTLENVEAKTEEEAVAKVFDALEWETDEVEVTMQARVGDAWASDSVYVDISYTFDFSDADVYAYEMGA